MNVLLVEDDASIGAFLRRGIEAAGHLLDWTPDGLTGLDYVSAFDYDAVILDLMLPGHRRHGRLRAPPTNARKHADPDPVRSRSGRGPGEGLRGRRGPTFSSSPSPSTNSWRDWRRTSAARRDRRTIEARCRAARSSSTANRVWSATANARSR